jgi:hypothetical protein
MSDRLLDGAAQVKFGLFVFSSISPYSTTNSASEVPGDLYMREAVIFSYAGLAAAAYRPFTSFSAQHDMHRDLRPLFECLSRTNFSVGFGISHAAQILNPFSIGWANDFTLRTLSGAAEIIRPCFLICW